MTTYRLLHGDAQAQLATLPAESVQTCITSPPYYGLRDYGVPGQLGLEATPDAYVQSLVEVFREVRRVLRDDGTVWLNLGDSYAGSGKGGDPEEGKQATNRGSQSVGVLYGKVGDTAREAAVTNVTRKTFNGIKAKDLIGIPWRVAFALQADGWYLRSDIIWSKPNPMPESVTDRPTKAHEYFFLLSKSARYFYDADAIREGISEAGVVAGSDGYSECSILGQHFGLQDTSPAFAAVCVRLASTVLDLAQRENDLSLFALDAEIGQQGADGLARLPVVHVPVVRRAATEASRFADGDISAKEFLEQMHSLCVALPDGDDLKKAWGLAALHVGHINADGYAAIAVNDSGKVSKVERIHTGNTTARVPSLRKLEYAAANIPGQSRHGYTMRDDGLTTMAPKGRRNKRSVWHVATQPYPEAHFATYPEKLIEPCILAGSRLGDTVLDPFTGSGTTGAVALRHQRNFVGCELNADYIQLARKRMLGVAPLFSEEQSA